MQVSSYAGLGTTKDTDITSLSSRITKNGGFNHSLSTSIISTSANMYVIIDFQVNNIGVPQQSLYVTELWLTAK